MLNIDRQIELELVGPSANQGPPDWQGPTPPRPGPLSATLTQTRAPQLHLNPDQGPSAPP